MDLIVGIPSYNEADSIGYVVEQVDLGLTKYFGNYKCKIVNIDNDSPDNTKEVFLNTSTKTEKVYITTPPGVKGKGNNFLNLFTYASTHKVKAVVVVDSDLKSITPEWVKKLIEPVLFNNKDFVSPLYLRHKYDGTITNHVIYPLVYSLFNTNIRQPIGGDFGLSKKIIDYYLLQVWEETTKQYGIDIFMTMHALLGGFKTEQVLLGAKIHKTSTPKLGEMATQVITTFFNTLINNKQKFSELNGNPPATQEIITSEEPPNIIGIEAEAIKQISLDGFNNNKKMMEEIFNGLSTKVQNIFSVDFNINSKLWAQIVYKFLNVYQNSNERAKMIDSFKALYFARLHSFMNETTNLSSLEAENVILEQGKIFHSKKSDWITPAQKITIRKAY